MCGPVNLHHHVQSFLRGGNFVELRRNQEEKPTERATDGLTDRPGRCPRQPTDASDMTGPAISSLAVEG